MKFHFNKITSFFILVFIVCIGYLYLKQERPYDDHTQVTRIAIFEPATHPAINEIVQGFIESMDDSEQKYVYMRYNANGDKILLHSQAQEILQQEYDLVFSIGLGCSLAMKELSCKRHNSTPIIFCAVDDPIKFGLEGTNLTGVIDSTNYAEQLSIVLQLQPSIQNIILIYDASQGSGLGKDKDEISSILKSKNRSLKSIEINSLGEMQQKVTTFMDEADLVMVLKDNTIVSGLDILIKLCHKYQVPLLATDLNSGVKGAALAYGIYESDSGIESAKQAKLILNQKIQPDKIPVAVIDKMVMKVNVKQAKMQGFNIDFENISIDHVELN